MSSSNDAVAAQPSDDETDKRWPAKPLDHLVVAKKNVTTFLYTWKISDFAKCLQGSSPLQNNIVSNPGFQVYIWLRLVHKCEKNFDLDTLRLQLYVQSHHARRYVFEPPALLKACVVRSDGVKTYIVEDQKSFQLLYHQGSYTINTFARQDLLNEDNGLLNNGELTVMCSVTFALTPSGTNENPADQELEIRPTPVNQFSDVLAGAFKRNLYPDVKLVAAGKELHAHRAVLAANSSVFQAKIEQLENSQADSSEIVIDDFTAEAIDGMLAFIYEGWTPSIRSNPFTLLALAHHYDIDSLKSSCEEELALRVTSNNAADMMLLAECHKAPQLQQATVYWIARNPRDVTATDAWKVVLQHNGLLKEIAIAQAKLLQSMSTSAGLPLSTRPTGLTDRQTARSVTDNWWPPGGSVDHCIPFKMKANTFTNCWKIENFTECLRQQPPISSDQLDGNGCTVCMKLIHTDGQGFELKMLQLEVQLSSLSSYGSNVVGLFRACVVRPDGIKTNIVEQKNAFFPVSSQTVCHQFGPFLRRDDALSEERPLLKNNELTIMCGITIISNTNYGNWYPPDPADVPRLIVPLAAKINNSLAVAYKEKKFTDITLVVGEQQFAVHRAFLASASSVFKRMFEAEVTAKTITIEDFEPEVVDDMLDFIYTGRAHNIRQNARGLLAAADKFDLKSLKVHCELEMATTLAAENAADTLLLARRHSAPQLKQTALHWISRHLCDVMATEGWKALSDDTGAMADLVSATANYLHALMNETE